MMLTNFAEWNRLARYRLIGQFVAIVLLAGLAGGCGKSSPGSVSGKVMFKGEPVVHGDITFFQTGTVHMSQSSLDSEGSYTLNLTQISLPPGEYKVMVAPSVTYVEVEGPGGREQRAVVKGQKSIPKIYRGRKSTRLTATITGGEDTFDFDLK